jgi:hypothetical protein
MSYATIETRDRELKAFHAEVIAKPKAPPKSPGPYPTLSMADSEIIAKARSAKNGAKFERLWRGDISEYGGDDSRADMALCSIIGFYTQDPDQIDRIFKTSGLIREKWNRPTAGSTYGRKTIEKVLASLTETYQAPRSSPRTEESSQRVKHQGLIATVSGPPAWPQEIMAGAAGNFSRVYSEYLETPESFLFMNYLTTLGHVISDRITLKSELGPEPRLYTVNLGESADTRKSTSVNKTTKFFAETLDHDALHEVLGVGSAEGLAKAFKKNFRVLLVSDELNALIQKMRIDASVLSPCICTLFESNRFHSLTKKHEITIDDAELCMLAACTLDTYRGMFTSQFLDIGLLNRFFVVIGDSKRRFSIPEPIPDPEREPLRQDLRNVLSFVDAHSQSGRFAMPINTTARDIFDEWYFNLENSVFTKRLDTYGHRLMPLLAVNELQYIITPEIAMKTVALLNYQLAARKYADPIDADSAVAKLEERIRRLLANGPMKKRDLERHGKKSRVGIWMWNVAIKNLTEDEITYDQKEKIYSKIA